MVVTINGTEFFIEEFDDGYGWTTKEDESRECYSELYEAEQDAINYMIKKINDEQERDTQNLIDEVYGTYEQQVQNLYNDIMR